MPFDKNPDPNPGGGDDFEFEAVPFLLDPGSCGEVIMPVLPSYLKGTICPRCCGFGDVQLRLYFLCTLLPEMLILKTTCCAALTSLREGGIPYLKKHEPPT